MNDNLIRQRNIAFSKLHPDPDQLRAACNFLRDLDGIQLVSQKDELTLEVHYVLNIITLCEIEDRLYQEGFRLDNRLITKMKRALEKYSEETACLNMGCAKCDCNSTTRIFASNYRRHIHGCRDSRPEHWRKYL